MDQQHTEEAVPAVSVRRPSGGVVPVGEDGLTDMQRAFAQAFIENGGRAGDAAITAGYAHNTFGVRCLAKKKVQDEIVRRVKMQAGSALAIALGGLFRIIESSEDDRAVVAASLGLMDRFGMAPPKGPAVAVQVNNAAGSQAQIIIADIWKARQARLTQQDGE